MEVPGPWYFPPVASLITSGGRLLLAMLERMVTDAGGTYLMCDTDSMAIVSSEKGEFVCCEGGANRMPDGADAIKALPWKQVRQIVDRFKNLNPYDPNIVPGSVLNIVEELNYDADDRQRQLYGYGISAKRYGLYARPKASSFRRRNERGASGYVPVGQDEQYIVQLIQRVTSVSLETLKLIRQLPEKLEFSAPNAGRKTPLSVG